MTWHTTTRIAENVYRISEPFGAIEPRVGVTTVNMYLVIGQECAALIDSGMGIGNVCTEIAKITSLPCTVLNSHFHWDHNRREHYDCLAHIKKARHIWAVRREFARSLEDAPPEFVLEVVRELFYNYDNPGHAN